MFRVLLSHKPSRTCFRLTEWNRSDSRVSLSPRATHPQLHSAPHHRTGDETDAAGQALRTRATLRPHLTRKWNTKATGKRPNRNTHASGSRGEIKAGHFDFFM